MSSTIAIDAPFTIHKNLSFRPYALLTLNPHLSHPIPSHPIPSHPFLSSVITYGFLYIWDYAYLPQPVRRRLHLVILTPLYSSSSPSHAIPTFVSAVSPSHCQPLPPFVSFSISLCSVIPFFAHILLHFLSFSLFPSYYPLQFTPTSSYHLIPLRLILEKE